MLERSVPSQIQFSRRDDVAHVLFRDYETRGVLPLGKVGVHRYAADPRTDVLCCAFAVDSEPVKLWTPGDAIPVEFREAATNPNWIVVAHNCGIRNSDRRAVAGAALRLAPDSAQKTALYPRDGVGPSLAWQT